MKRIQKSSSKNALHQLTASEAIQKIKAKEITAVDFIRSCFKQIKKREPRIKAWVCLDKNLALREAQAVDQKISLGQTVGLLAGIPVGIKDIFNTADLPTQMGSPIWKNFTPGNDARVVSYLRWENAIIPGKTVTAEFAVHTPGPTHNPHRYGYMTGTSSSGSAAAVAAQMIPVALGTQTAGSIIRPASYCGVYGMKPSFGLIPRTGMLKTTDTLDTIGFLSRGIEDLKLLFEILHVKGANHPISQKKLLNYRKEKKHSWKVGLVTSTLWVWKEAEFYAQKTIISFAKTLANHRSIRIEEALLPNEFNQAHQIHNTIYDKTLAYYFTEEYKQKKLISPVMYEIIERGNKISLAKYKQALEQQTNLAKKFEQFMEHFDLLLTLSTGGEPFKGLDSVDRPDSCLIWTLCHAPTINLPAFRGPLKLPFGAQILTKRFDDYNLLKFAKLLVNNKFIAPTTYLY